MAWTEPVFDPLAPIAPPLSGPWDSGPPLSNELEARIRRDLVRGRKIVRLTWVAALASLVLGLVAVRQAALLVAIDRRLVTTEEVQAAGASFDAARTVLIGSIVIGAALAIRWLRGALPDLEALRARGWAPGPPPRTARHRDRLSLLWRASGVPAERAGWADLRVGHGRRVAWLALGAVGLAVAVGLVAALWLGAARDADMSRLLRVVSGLDGALWLIASILVGVAFDAILWREAAAARALGVFIPLVDAPGRAIVRLVPPLLLFGAGILVASERPEPWFVPCPQATLTCDGMLVPVDHDGGSSATIWIVYAVHRASVEPRGTLAIAVGGPGSSGLDAAVARIRTLDEELVRTYDILFFDQRGIGASEGRDCPDAGAQYLTDEGSATSAATYVDDCLQEAGVDPTTLARYATRQAADDLESIRDRLGVDRLAVYGESYGTELAQAYAALHPDRVSALILDGSVDLTRSAIDFWADAAHGFDRVLRDTLEACRTEPACSSDVGDPVEAYDRALRLLAAGPTLSYADSDGVVRDHEPDVGEIQVAIGTLLYEPMGRMLIQRAVAAADDGDLVPMTRLVDAFGSGEPGGFSSFAYHAILSADYRLSPTAAPHDAAAVAAAAERLGVTGLRMAEVFSSPYPCLFWPYQPTDGTRPPPLTATPFPVFVLGATDDPITPVDQAQAIAARLADGYLIVTAGGPHVTFGREDACVDDPVVGFLVEGRRPASRSITCPGLVADAYIDLTPSSAALYGDALDAMEAAESELLADPGYRLWDGSDEVRIGCRHGGFVAITGGTGQDGLRFADCAFVTGVALRGTGRYVFADHSVSWSVTVGEDQLEYASGGGSRHVTGTWKGRAVDLTR
jgi:pimeloyl-ACP methyl ester carboxylesterase